MAIFVEDNGRKMKRFFAFMCMVFMLAGAMTLSACGFDSPTSLEDDSQITAIKLIYKDGYTVDLSENDIAFVKEQILSVPNFEADSKILVQNKWKFEFDYTFRITAIRKQLFKKVETEFLYRFGTTGIYTDGSGKESKTRFENEWTYYTIANSRRIANTTDERAAAIRDRLDAIVNGERQRKYDWMKSEFLSNGFELRELNGAELVSLPDPNNEDEYIHVGATKGFEAVKTSTYENYKIYYTTVENAKKAFDRLSGTDCRKNDTFFGYGFIAGTDNILHRLFA